MAVARQAFAIDGIEVPIREVARRAEVGVATVYRHFPTKDDLLAAAFAEQMASCVQIHEDGLAHDDPWQGLCAVIERLMEVHALDRGFARAFTSRINPPADLAGEREHALTLLVEVLRRARSAGALRPDVLVEDLAVLLMANEGIRAESLEQRVAASRRFAALAVQSLRNGPDLGALPRPAGLSWQP